MTDDEKLTELEGRAVACPNVNHARIVAPGDRVPEIVMPIELRDALLTELHTLRQRNARLVELVEQAENIFQHCSVTDGVCCCGDDMAKHADPMSVGHTPVDHGSYVVDGWISRLQAARTLIEDNSNG